MAHKLVGKAEAKKRGLPTYNDTPCPKCGHSEPYTNSGKCIHCHTERNKARKWGKAGETASKAVAPINSGPINGDWRFYSDRITTTWQKAVESIIETGKHVTPI
jgi:hypothetical protein